MDNSKENRIKIERRLLFVSIYFFFILYSVNWARSLPDFENIFILLKIAHLFIISYFALKHIYLFSRSVTSCLGPMLPIFIFYIIAIIMSPLSENYVISIFYSLLGIFMTLVILTTRIDIDSIIYYITLSSFTVFTISIVTYFLFPIQDILTYVSYRNASFVHPNTSTLIILSAFLLNSYICPGKGKTIIITWICLLLSIFLFQSRTNTFIFIYSCLVFFLIKYDKSEYGKINISFFLSSIILVSGILISIIAILSPHTPMWLRLEGIKNFTGRIAIWEIMFNHIKQLWPIGSGYIASSRSEDIQEMLLGSGTHNAAIEAISALGIFGLLCFMWSIYILIKFSLFNLPKSIGFFASSSVLVYILLQNAFGSGLFGIFGTIHIFLSIFWIYNRKKQNEIL